MTDQEFDVLDELYFVQSFEEVMEATGLPAETLRDLLHNFIEKGWVRCMQSRNEDVDGEEINFQEAYQRYFYLATKAGLLAHNSR